MKIATILWATLALLPSAAVAQRRGIPPIGKPKPFPAAAQVCIDRLKPGRWNPTLCDTAINRGALVLYDMLAAAGPDIADLSGYGNHMGVHGGITARPYGVDGDGNTGTYLEAASRNLSPSPLSSGPELSANGTFIPSGGSIPGWTCAATLCAPSATYLTAVDYATFTGHSAAISSGENANSIALEQVIPVTGGTVYDWGFWTRGTGTAAVEYEFLDASNGDAVIYPRGEAGDASKAFSFVSAHFITPENCTSVKVRFIGPRDGSTGYVAEFSLHADLPITIGILFRRSGPPVSERQYLFTQLFDLEDGGVANLEPSRIWFMQFTDGFGLPNYGFNGFGNSEENSAIAGPVPPTSGDWHYWVISQYAVPDKFNGYPFYRTMAVSWIDGARVAQFDDPTPSQPIYPDRGTAPLRIFATDATGNEHNFLGSVAFAHINRMGWTDQDARGAASCMRGLLVARGQSPSWAGSSDCPVGSTR